MATKNTSVKKASAKAKKEVIEAVDAVEDAVETAAETVLSSVSKKVSGNVEHVQGLAKNVWFAYLGAAGLVVKEAKGQYEKLNKERTNLVEDLVSRGEKVQDEAESFIKNGRSTVEEQIEVAKVRVTSAFDMPARLKSLADKIEGLSKDLKKAA